VAGGPLVNVVLCVISGLLLWTQGIRLPFAWMTMVGPGFAELSDWRWWTWFVFSMNYGLLVFNLMPIYPLDGGQMLNAILWPWTGYRRAMLFSAATGLVGCVVLIGIGACHCLGLGLELRQSRLRLTPLGVQLRLCV
jgi:Zn-dependent protease